MELVNIQAEIWWHEHFSEVLSSSAEEQNPYLVSRKTQEFRYSPHSSYVI